MAQQRDGDASETLDAAAARARPIWLCADDYGISPAVNAAIRDLAARGRLNATSVMTAAPSFGRSEAMALKVFKSGARCFAIGLHVTLTAPFAPLSTGFKPLRDGAFPPLGSMLLRSALRQLDRDRLDAEVGAQLQRFTDLFGQAPDFIDGHQHVHLFPQVRDAVLATASRAAPKAWLRQCGSAAPLARRLSDRKGLLIAFLSRPFRRRAAALGMATNPAFAGTYDFAATPDPAALFAGFLEHLPAGGLVMCHPGHVDAELIRLDPVTEQREREYAFLSGDAFVDLLRRCGVTLA